MSRFRAYGGISTDRVVVSSGSRLRARPGPHRRHWIIRPDDLVVLDFALEKMTVVPDPDGKAAKVQPLGSGTRYLIVTLPPQHLTEIAYFTTVPNYPVSKPEEQREGEPPSPDPDQASGDETPDDPPIDARLAGWSTLVFKVRDDQLPFDWTLEGVLAGSRISS